MTSLLAVLGLATLTSGLLSCMRAELLALLHALPSGYTPQVGQPSKCINGTLPGAPCINLLLPHI